MKAELLLMPAIIFGLFYGVYRGDAFIFSFFLMILVYVISNMRERQKLSESELKVLRKLIDDIELSERQREILSKLSEGKNISEIANELGVSRNTVYKDLQLILKDLEAFREAYSKLEELLME